MKWPRIKDVASELEGINANVEGECDVRLQVWSDGQWRVRYGDPGYDRDHSGFWGAGSVPGVVDGEEQDLDAHDLARELIEQCRDMEAQ